jgi:hypothetical protein
MLKSLKRPRIKNINSRKGFSGLRIDPEVIPTLIDTWFTNWVELEEVVQAETKVSFDDEEAM